ncbi:DUF6531 domain-containing protein [Arhodomonas sp. AD133]|uniref:DUF6531 domain-containing protein n=1 Tax=Arhodomonas sp. AD133 TaxID=3415009 RepID=UPI003EBC79E6
MNVAVGNKYQHDTDFVLTGPFPLRFERSYNSRHARPSTMGAHWRHTYERKVLVAEHSVCDDGDGESCVRLHLVRADGKEIGTGSAPTEWSVDTVPPGYEWQLPPYIRGSLTSTREGYRYVTANDEVELYDKRGRLLSVTNREGASHTLHYDEAGLLVAVEGPTQWSMTFEYDEAGRVSVVRAPGGRLYRYNYDDDGRLVSVTYPDGSGSSVRKYHYENTDYPTHLTGITDRNGQRFATWSYDDQGRAVSSEHADGVERYTLDYEYLNDDRDPRVTVTNPHGKQSTLHLATIHGLRRVTEVEGHPTEHCAAANRSYTYTPEGRVASKTDWQGHTTTYEYNDRGLVTRMVEAAGTSAERVTTKQWHPDFREPVRVTESDRVIDYRYDANGRLIERTVRARP